MASDSDEDDLFDEEPESPETKRQRVEQQQAAAVPAPPQSLYELILNQKWDNVVTRVTLLRQQHNESRITELHIQNGDLGMTPLQLALESGAPARVILVLIDEFTVQDDNEFLPGNALLKACESYPETVITNILNCAQQLVMKKDHESQMNVFHVVLQKKPSLGLIELMAETYANEKNMDISQAWKELLSMYDHHGVLPVFYAIQEHAPTNVILKLLNEYPKSVYEKIKNHDGDMSTVHHAAFHGCSYLVMNMLLEHYGAGKLCVTKNTNGRRIHNTPLHLLFHPDNKQRWLEYKHKSNNKDDDTMMPPRKMVWFLLIAFSENLNKTFGHKKGNPKEQANKLIFETKGEGKKTIYERALELSKLVNSQELKMVISDFEALRRHQDFPEMNFEN